MGEIINDWQWLLNHSLRTASVIQLEDFAAGIENKCKDLCKGSNCESASSHAVRP